MFMKGLSTEQNVHKSMNIVHDLATLAASGIKGLIHLEACACFSVHSGIRCEIIIAHLARARRTLAR